MNEQEFEQLEKRVMEKLLAGDDEVLENLCVQYKGAAVTDRTFTGVGFFSTFQVDEKSPMVACRQSIQITDVHGRCDELAHGIGFVLFLKDGVIDFLEGATYDEKWPDNLTNLRLSYLPEIPADSRDMEELRKNWRNDQAK